MKRLMLTLLVGICLAPELCGQSPSFKRPASPPEKPIDRRALRELAVHHAGTSSRSLVESVYGDEAALALLNCSGKTASRLVEFHNSGGLSRVCCPRELLLCVAGPDLGDAICRYVVEHEEELADRDCCEAFLSKPQEFVLNLKKLSDAAKERRDRRNPMQWLSNPSSIPNNVREWACSLALGVIGILIVSRVRHGMARDGPA
jgi:hypothetical protein